MQIIKQIINFGLLSTPFIILKGMNTRVPKEILAFYLAIIIVLFGINDGIKKVKNKWLLIFLTFTFIAIYQAPKFGIQVFNTHILNPWIWQAQFYLIIYSLMLIVIAGMEFTKKEINLTLNIMWICGFIMSLYIFIQYLGLDQFFKIATIKQNPDIKYLTNALLVGSLGNSTICSPFIAMLIPIALYKKKIIPACCMCSAVWLCDSKVALLAMIISSSFYLILKLKRHGVILIIGILITGSIYCCQQKENINKFCQYHNNGRFGAWQNIWEDFTSPPLEKRGMTKKYCMTGFGAGSYPFIHPVKYKTRFINAHNEYLELTYNWGVIGLGLFLMAVYAMLKNVYKSFFIQERGLKQWNKRTVALLMSLFCISLCALGTFPWQIGTTIFYSVVIVGFLSNDFLLKLRG